MSIVDWIETGALVVVTFGMIGIFRLLFAHTSTMVMVVAKVNEQSETINAQSTIILQNAESLAHNAQALAWIQSHIVRRLDEQGADVDAMRAALAEVSSLLAYAQQALDPDIDTETETA